MKLLFKSIHKWTKERKIHRELKKDQELRERCIDYVSRNPGRHNLLYAEAVFKYIKNGSLC